MRASLASRCWSSETHRPSTLMASLNGTFQAMSMICTALSNSYMPLFHRTSSRGLSALVRAGSRWPRTRRPRSQSDSRSSRSPTSPDHRRWTCRCSRASSSLWVTDWRGFAAGVCFSRAYQVSAGASLPGSIVQTLREHSSRTGRLRESARPSPRRGWLRRDNVNSVGGVGLCAGGISDPGPAPSSGRHRRRGNQRVCTRVDRQGPSRRRK